VPKFMASEQGNAKSRRHTLMPADCGTFSVVAACPLWRQKSHGFVQIGAIEGRILNISNRNGAKNAARYIAGTLAERGRKFRRFGSRSIKVRQAASPEISEDRGDLRLFQG